MTDSTWVLSRVGPDLNQTASTNPGTIHFQDAIDAYQQALKIRSAADPVSTEVAVTLSRIARSQDWLHQPRLALQAYERALAIDEARSGKESLAVAVDLAAMANVQSKLDEYPAAATSLQRALDIRTARLDLLNPAIANTLLQQAALYDGMAHYSQALDAARRAVAIAMVVDACRSAASVDCGEFKPGPMRSRGLGQLAFDKGMRLLAAS